MYFIYCNGHYLYHNKIPNDPFHRSTVSCSESKGITNHLWDINGDNSIHGLNGENIISNHIGWISERSNILLLGEHDYDLIIYPLKMIVKNKFGKYKKSIAINVVIQSMEKTLKEQDFIF